VKTAKVWAEVRVLWLHSAAWIALLVLMAVARGVRGEISRRTGKGKAARRMEGRDVRAHLGAEG